jgi:hypothetical protein
MHGLQACSRAQATGFADATPRWARKALVQRPRSLTLLDRPRVLVNQPTLRAARPTTAVFESHAIDQGNWLIGVAVISHPDRRCGGIFCLTRNTWPAIPVQREQEQTAPSVAIATTAVWSSK